jgi:hypothetical protein
MGMEKRRKRDEKGMKWEGEERKDDLGMERERRREGMGRKE